MHHLSKFLLIIFFLPFTSLAQKTEKQVIWYYNYFVGNDTLIFGKVYQDSKGNPMKFDRFQFYTSGVELIQTGNDTLKVPDSYVLSSGTDGGHDLGKHMLGDLESVVFRLGVDSQTNHTDPSTYPENHALYHKIPSMHWGWETGYRFWVIEGWIDDDRDGKFTNRFEFHIVGDPLLKTAKINTPGILKDNKLFVVIDVDLLKLLNGIDLTQNNVFHGGPWDHGSGPIIKIAGNSVGIPAFKAGSSFNLNAATPETPALNIWPNPAQTGILNFEFGEEKPLDIRIINALGTEVDHIDPLSGFISTKSWASGLYFIQVAFQNGASARYKVLVQN